MIEEPQIIEVWSKERILGSGGFGIVTLWKNNVTEEFIAIKKYRPGVEVTKKQKERWCQEVEMIRNIDHKNVVSYKHLPEVLEQALTPYNLSKLPMLSMEYCTGGDLRETLNRSANCCGLPEAVCRDILFDVKNAIEYLHSKAITHRDIKPENIVLQQTDERPSKFIYKLTDLGYAKELDSNSIDASLVGTIQYLAPEILCAKSYSNSVDYWSFGLIAFEIICGVRPFLPNYAELGIWMEKVEQKQSEHICIYNTIDNQIIYSEQMYSTNHVTKTFKNKMEKWLRYALEWNSKKRGRNENDNKIIIFSMLDDILSKKILSIYSVTSYQFVSYEIDESTLITTLQTWIERDLSLSITDQFILDFYGVQILSDGLCMDYFDETYNSPMLYVFHKDHILPTNKEMLLKSPLVPKDVQPLLVDPKRSCSYFYQKRVYSQALFFVYSERRLYDTLLDSCVVKINFLIQNFTKSRARIQQMYDHTIELNAYKDFSNYLLKMDELNYNKLQKFENQVYGKWCERYQKITLDIEKLREATNKLKTRYESAFRRVNNLSTDYCDTYSKDKVHDLTSRQINDLKKEYDQILIVISNAQDHIKKYKNDLCQLQSERQQELWQYLLSESSQKMNCNGNTNSYTVHKPLKFITGDSKLAEVTNMPNMSKDSMFMVNSMAPFDLSTLSSEVVGIINDNANLRHQLEHKTNESLLQIEEIMKTNFDFNLE
ncbi:inhibitor of nuclear factor kappa-B kinase subunit beta isoform X2 [Chrysoperla carnea]|uniref:inhibitor of nuclear factor kappa-B kinase subunit beta isoform X2 n=1 Tax=Chrysoperla carnea TaxID=189513 RepID=UPI001D077C20|nr:inhibitor of nuclear factor kappa-B kinase subunit beta isoform X2 [Chrysoperla carnea]